MCYCIVTDEDLRGRNVLPSICFTATCPLKNCPVICVTSIEARLRWAPLLRRMGNGASATVVWRDSASSNALSMNLFVPMADSVKMVLEARDHDSGPSTAMLCQWQQCIKCTMRLITLYRTVTITIHDLQCM